MAAIYGAAAARCPPPWTRALRVERGYRAGGVVDRCVAPVRCRRRIRRARCPSCLRPGVPSPWRKASRGRTWAEVAAATGRIVHPEMQLHQISRLPGEPLTDRVSDGPSRTGAHCRGTSWRSSPACCRPTPQRRTGAGSACGRATGTSTSTPSRVNVSQSRSVRTTCSRVRSASSPSCSTSSATSRRTSGGHTTAPGWWRWSRSRGRTWPAVTRCRRRARRAAPRSPPRHPGRPLHLRQRRPQPRPWD